MKDYDKIIEKRNKMWDNATRQEKKILVCKDVLSMIEMPNYIVNQGHYLNFPEATGYQGHVKDFSNEHIQKDLLSGGVTCTACARGQMMLSRFRFKGVGGMENMLCDNFGTETALQDAFDKEELGFIEAIFEMDPQYAKDMGPWSLSQLLVNFQFGLSLS